jgi:type IV pilus assembly protein PilB
MFATHDSAIEQLLRRHGLITPAQLELLRQEARVLGRPLAQGAVASGLVRRETLLQHVAHDCGCAFLAQLPAEIPASTTAGIPSELAQRHGILPWRADAATVDVLVADPFDLEMRDALAFTIEREVRYFAGDPDDIWARMHRSYGTGRAEEETAAAELSEKDIETMAGAESIVAYVDDVLGRAVRERASDIHFEPFEREFKLRLRIDGVLHELPSPPRHLAQPILSRVKVLAGLNITERRVAQDGRLKLTTDGRRIDLRVSTLPTEFGESVVLRILDQSAVQLDLAELGLPAAVLAGLRDVLRRPNGIFIVTGPTGCGKTTTLYSGLRFINTADLKLLTVEDPVEYEIEGIMQVPVNPAAGLTFAAALRSFLRQDPDVMMVGEIRDLETAQIAIQAALTGHLVLTTLHTNDAAGAITRLIDMGVEPFLLASTLEAVLAQRLVRRVCGDCTGKGCPQCNQSGYRGRLGIFEYLPMNDELRELVAARGPVEQLRQKAVEQGMRPLREDGMRAVERRWTTTEEVLKFT